MSKKKVMRGNLTNVSALKSKGSNAPWSSVYGKDEIDVRLGIAAVGSFDTYSQEFNNNIKFWNSISTLDTNPTTLTLNDSSTNTTSNGNFMGNANTNIRFPSSGTSVLSNGTKVYFGTETREETLDQKRRDLADQLKRTLAYSDSLVHEIYIIDCEIQTQDKNKYKRREL
jgi:hypothetical protein